MPSEVRLTIFIVICVLLGLFFLFLFLYPPIKNFLRKNYTVRSYYKKIMRVAEDNDYYLINQWAMKWGEGKNEGIHIDHILFGNKYIYVIKDRYYRGAITAKAEDRSWVYYRSKKSKKYIDNPLLLNKIRADRLSISANQPRQYFVSIVLVNDDCLVTPFHNLDDGNYLLSLSQLPKFINNYESRKVKPFSEKELSAVVRDLAALNQNERK